MRWLDLSAFRAQAFFVRMPGLDGPRTAVLLAGGKGQDERWRAAGFRPVPRRALWWRLAAPSDIDALAAALDCPMREVPAETIVRRLPVPLDLQEDWPLWRARSLALGENARGEQVWDVPEVGRVVVAGEAVTAEREAGSSPRFLRAAGADDIPALLETFFATCPTGRFWAADGWSRFVRATRPDGAPSETWEEELLRRAPAVLWTFLERRHPHRAEQRLRALHGALAHWPEREALAQRHPDAWNALARLAPAAAASRILALETGRRVVVPGPFASVLGRGDEASEPPRRLAFVSLEPVRNGEGGRADLADLRRLLGEREADGLAVAVLPDDVETRGVLADLAAQFEGLDAVARWSGAGGESLLVALLSARRKRPLPEAPEPRVVDGEPWSVLAHAAADHVRRRTQARAAELEPTSAQVPYASPSGESHVRIARELAEPTVRALAACRQRALLRHGTADPAARVADAVGMSREEVARRLEPHQIDAVALALDAQERGRGFLVGDQTGLGKGRVLAALMLAALRRGERVLFVTEKPLNLRDIVRDLHDLGAFEHGLPGAAMALRAEKTFAVSAPDGTVVVSPETYASARDALRAGRWPEGVALVLATYAQLAAPLSKTARDEAPERGGTALHGYWLERLATGDEPVAVFLDESHNATPGSHAARRLLPLLRRAPTVVYASATWAKDARAFGEGSIYERLFPRRLHGMFAGRGPVAEMGYAGLETMAEVLAEDGVYVARQHDFSRCDIRLADLPPDVRATVREAADALARVLAEMAMLSGELERMANEANERLRAALAQRYPDDEPRAERMFARLRVPAASLGAPLYEIHRAFLASLLAPVSARLAIEALDAGRKPILLFDRTLDAALSVLRDDAAGDVAGVHDFRSFLRLMAQRQMKRFRGGGRLAHALLHEPAWLPEAERMLESLRAACPIEDDGTLRDRLEALRAEAEDATAAEAALARIGPQLEVALQESGALTPSVLTVVDERLPMTPLRALRRVNRLIEKLPSVPLSAIDELVRLVEEEGRRRHESGLLPRPWRIGELTGRRWVVRDGAIVPREAMRREDVVDAFQNGGLDALVVNATGSTGIDLHDSPKYGDQRPRTMIVVQSLANPEREIQAYGRINRFGQLNRPEVVVPVTGLPAEMRLLAMRNAKLRRLSAMVSASRETQWELRDIPDMLNALGDRVVAEYLQARPQLCRRLGFDIASSLELESDDVPDVARSANRVLARLSMLPIAVQETVLQDLADDYATAAQEAEMKGEDALRLQELAAPPVPVGAPAVLVPGRTGADASACERACTATTAQVRVEARGARWDEVEEAIERGMAAFVAQGWSGERFAEELGRLRETYLAGFLRRGEMSVAQALERGDPAVTRAAMRFDRLLNAVRHFEPGAILRVSDATAPNGVRVGVLTQVELRCADPSRRWWKLHPPAWRAEACLAGRGRWKTDLGTLLRDTEFQMYPRGTFPVRMLRETFDRAGVEERPVKILSGNLFEALALSRRHGLGRLVRWREDGSWRKGVLVERKHWAALEPLLQDAERSVIVDGRAELERLVRAVRDGAVWRVTAPGLTCRLFAREGDDFPNCSVHVVANALQPEVVRAMFAERGVSWDEAFDRVLFARPLRVRAERGVVAKGEAAETVLRFLGGFAEAGAMLRGEPLVGGALLEAEPAAGLRVA